MSTATFDQAKQFLTLVSQKNVPAEKLQAIYNSGLLSDLLDGNLDEVNRDEFRRILGLRIWLKFVGRVIIPAKIGRFVATEKFVLGDKSSVGLNTMNHHFVDRFLDGGGKIEYEEAKHPLVFRQLEKTPKCNESIIDDLGFGVGVETTLSDIFSLLEMSARGVECPLEGGLLSNIFYTRDRDNVLQRIDVSRCGNSWSVMSGPIRDVLPIRLNAGRVFSRR